MAWLGLRRRDSTVDSLLSEAGENALAAAELLVEMLAKWPDESESLAREILKAEQEGDRITQATIKRLNTGSSRLRDRDDYYRLATQLDDVVDYTEEVADFLILYGIEAPMAQAEQLAEVLLKACAELRGALAGLADGEDLEPRWIEIHRLENEGDRISRDAVASLFANGIDPMIVIRWKDIFAGLERAIDSTESAAHIIEGIVLKSSRTR